MQSHSLGRLAAHLPVVQFVSTLLRVFLFSKKKSKNQLSNRHQMHAATRFTSLRFLWFILLSMRTNTSYQISVNETNIVRINAKQKRIRLRFIRCIIQIAPFMDESVRSSSSVLFFRPLDIHVVQKLRENNKKTLENNLLQNDIRNAYQKPSSSLPLKIMMNNRYDKIRID